MIKIYVFLELKCSSQMWNEDTSQSVIILLHNSLEKNDFNGILNDSFEAIHK